VLKIIIDSVWMVRLRERWEYCRDLSVNNVYLICITSQFSLVPSKNAPIIKLRTAFYEHAPSFLRLLFAYLLAQLHYICMEPVDLHTDLHIFI